MTVAPRRTIDPWWRRWFGSRSERAAARFLRLRGMRVIIRNDHRTIRIEKLSRVNTTGKMPHLPNNNAVLTPRGFAANEARSGLPPDPPRARPASAGGTRCMRMTIFRFPRT